MPTSDGEVAKPTAPVCRLTDTHLPSGFAPPQTVLRFRMSIGPLNGNHQTQKKCDGSWTASQRLQRQATCSLVIYIGVDVHRSPQNNLDSVENHCNVLVIPGRLERLATRNATDGRRAGGPGRGGRGRMAKGGENISGRISVRGG